MRRALMAPLAIMLGFHVQAEEMPDDAALALADATVDSPTENSNMKLYSELGANQFRNQSGINNGQQFALDLFWRTRLVKGVDFTFSDRYDSYSNAYPAGGSEDVNTLREAYVDWQYLSNLAFQLGRVNVRTGVALGYNPTDYFKANSLREIHSVDPEYLRSNRQGSFLLDTQYLWRSGAVSLYYLPEIEQAPSSSTFSLDAGSTNASQRSLLVLSQQIGDTFRPQFCVFNQLGEKPAYGFNLTQLYQDNTIFYVELSSGAVAKLADQVTGIPAAETYKTKSATGFTYTTDFKLSLTAEFEYNGAGFDKDEWRALQQQGGIGLINALIYSQDTLSPPAKRSWFYHANWKDFLKPNLSLAGFVRVSPIDNSKQTWLKLNYPFNDKFEASIQTQFNSGKLGSVYGSTGTDRIQQVLVRYYF